MCLSSSLCKLDKDGHGAFALQQGGGGLEYLRRMAIDNEDNVYTTGMTGSNPLYFDPLVVDTHMYDDRTSDLFVAKLSATEALPTCKSDADTISNGNCFVANSCYEDSASGRGQLSCFSCEGGGGGGSKKKKKSSNDSLALGLGLGLGLGGLLLIGLIAALCLSKKQKASTSTREQDVENEMVKTGAAMS